MVSTRAEIVTRRTYCRPKNDEGTEFETWEEVVDRVIRHQRWLWERALTHKILPGMRLKEITEDMLEWVKLNRKQEDELTELKQLMLERKALPSGRALWLGGTYISKTRESSMFNCSFSAIETVYDVVDLFWLLLQGCGVGLKPKVGSLNGFRKPITNIQIIRSKKLGNEKGRENNDETFIEGVWTISIGDSAEAWAKSVGKLLAGKHKAHTLILDFSQIRGAGYRLKGYGWLSSGDESISKAFPAICDIMNKKAGSILSRIDIIEIMNLLGTVLSSRRSAELTLVDYESNEWLDFANMKNNCYEEGHTHKQQSNNSLLFNKKPTKEELNNIFDMMVANGGSEPGFVNAVTMRERAPYSDGINPCGEILLPSKGFCNLVEVDVSKFKGNSAGLHETITTIARANYRQTVVDLRDGVLQEAWHLNNEFLRLCGVGLTGLASRDDLTPYDLRLLNKSANFAAREMAKELGLEYPKNVTTVKPSGTLSKIMDASGEGVHKPSARFLFNWINFSKHDPIVQKLKDANYNIINNPSDSTSMLACIPVEFKDVEFDNVEIERKDGTKEILEVNNESALVQLERYKKLQINYCDQNVSNTIYYKPEEIPEIIDWIYINWDIFVGLSFLFKNDPTVSAKDLGYAYLPQEYVSKEVFRKYEKELKEINWDNTDYEAELEDEGCVTGMCPIK